MEAAGAEMRGGQRAAARASDNGESRVKGVRVQHLTGVQGWPPSGDDGTTMGTTRDSFPRVPGP